MVRGWHGFASKSVKVTHGPKITTKPGYLSQGNAKKGGSTMFMVSDNELPEGANCSGKYVNIEKSGPCKISNKKEA